MLLLRPCRKWSVRPSIDRQGSLEDLFLEAVAGEPVMICTEDFFSCLQEKKGAHPRRNMTKAKVRVFLSAQEDLILPLGLAARKGYWPLDHPVFDRVRRFLESL